jgi:hypothetical protein
MDVGGWLMDSWEDEHTRTIYGLNVDEWMNAWMKHGGQ